MPMPWRQLVDTPEFKALAPDQQESTRQGYYTNFVAPTLQPHEVDIGRKQWDDLSLPTLARPAQPADPAPSVAAPDANIGAPADLPPPPKGSPGFLGGAKEAVRGAIAGTVSDIPEGAYGLASYAAQPEFDASGQMLPDKSGSVRDVARRGGEAAVARGNQWQESQTGQAAPEWDLSNISGMVRANAYEAGRMAPMSFAGTAIGAGIGFAVAGPPGAYAGGMLGFNIASLPLFFGSQAKHTYDNVYAAQKDANPDLTDEQAHDQAMVAGGMGGAIEAGGETIANKFFGGKFLRMIPGEAKGALVRSMTKGIQGLKPMLADVIKTIGVEVGTELAQGAGEQAVEHAYGAADMPTWDNQKQVIVPTILMTVASGGLFGAHNAAQRYRLAKALQDPSIDQERRLRAAQYVAGAVAQQDEELGQLFLRHSVPLIVAGKPVVTENDDFYRDLKPLAQRDEDRALAAGEDVIIPPTARTPRTPPPAASAGQGSFGSKEEAEAEAARLKAGSNNPAFAPRVVPADEFREPGRWRVVGTAPAAGDSATTESKPPPPPPGGGTAAPPVQPPPSTPPAAPAPAGAAAAPPAPLSPNADAARVKSELDIARAKYKALPKDADPKVRAAARSDVDRLTKEFLTANQAQRAAVAPPPAVPITEAPTAITAPAAVAPPPEAQPIPTQSDPTAPIPAQPTAAAAPEPPAESAAVVAARAQLAEAESAQAPPEDIEVLRQNIDLAASGKPRQSTPTERKAASESVARAMEDRKRTEQRMKARRSINREKDDILTIIGKLGGINRAALGGEVDEAHFKLDKGKGRSGEFTWHRKEGGLQLDHMTESLREEGLLPQDATGNDTLELIHRALRGDRIGHAEFHDAEVRRQAEDIAASEESARLGTKDAEREDTLAAAASNEASATAAPPTEAARRILLAATRGSGRVADLFGDRNAGARAEALSALRGAKVPKSKAGINALEAALYDAVGITGDTLASRQDRLAAWVRGEANEDAVNAAAHEAATSPLNDLPEPTDAQKKAGVYKMGHPTWHGLGITIENPEGSTRSGTDESGKAWSVTMHDHYGRLKRTEGSDGEEIDVFVNPDENRTDTVFVIDQLKGGKKGAGFDEHKLMLGYKDKLAAIAAYKRNYSKGWHVGTVTEASVDEIKDWLRNGDTKKEYANRGHVTPAAAEKAKHDEIDASFSRNREAIKRFKVGDAVEYFSPHTYTNDDGTKVTGKTFRGTITRLNPTGKDQAMVVVQRDNGGTVTIAPTQLKPAAKQESEAPAPEKPADEPAVDAAALTKAEAIAALVAGKRLVRNGETTWIEEIKKGRIQTYVVKAKSADSGAVFTTGPAGVDAQWGWGARDAAERATQSWSEPPTAAPAPAPATDFGAMFDDLVDEKPAPAAEQSMAARLYSALGFYIDTPNSIPDDGLMPRVRKASVKHPKAAELLEFLKQAKKIVAGIMRKAPDGIGSADDVIAELGKIAPEKQEEYEALLSAGLSAADFEQGIRGIMENMSPSAVAGMVGELTGQPASAPALPAPPTATQALGSAVKNTVSGVDNALKGLVELFGGTGGTVRSGLGGFSEETYAKAKPLFLEALSDFKNAAADLRAAMSAIIDKLRALGLDTDGVKRMRPYVVRFMEDFAKAGSLEGMTDSAQDEGERPGSAQPPTEASDEIATAPALDQPSPLTLDGEPAGEGGSPETAGNAGQGPRGSRPANRPGSRKPGGRGVRPGSGVGNGQGTVPVPASGGGGLGGTTAEPDLFSDPVGAPSDAGSQAGLPPDTGLTEPPQLPDDFTIEDDLELGEGGQKTKFHRNVDAIRILNEIERDGRNATQAEQRALALYVGWGGLPQAFDPSNADWRKEYDELKALLTDEEYEAARQSTQYAHYTSREIISAMYGALHEFGFRGGKTLEAGGGVGNFIGLMPPEMRTAGRFTLVERERIAAGIAKHLYPRQVVKLGDFTAYGAGSDGYYDLSLGNPPFSSTLLVDQSGRKHLSGLSIHNYFLAKSIDLLRPGGILANVVSNSFLDAGGTRAREYIADRARFLGAIRLPNNAFKKNAGTEVTTDIVFFQKLPESEWGSRAVRAEAEKWIGTHLVRDPNGGDDILTNQYFVDNPQMMLGTWGRYGTMYAKGQPALVAKPGSNLSLDLLNAIEKLPKGIYESAIDSDTKALQDRTVVALADKTVSEGGFYLDGGKLYQRIQDRGGEEVAEEITPETQWTEKTKLGAKGFARLKALATMRRTMRDLLAAEWGDDTKAMERLRASLNAQYDAYAKDQLINDSATSKVFGDDPDFPLLASLEVGYVPGLGKTAAETQGVAPFKSTAKKHPIFTKRMLDTRKPVTHAESPEDALNISMAERGALDAEYIGQLLGKDPDEAMKGMLEGDSPLLFMDPATNEYAIRDEYLSGNVRKKLEQAKRAGLLANARALERVLPADVGAGEISARVGSPWVPTSVYEAFATHLLGDGTRANLRYMERDGSFMGSIEAGSDVAERNTYGTSRMGASELLYKMLNSKEIRIVDYDSQGKGTTNKEATENARDKARDIRDKFQDWLFADTDRAAVLVRSYNDANNNYVTREYDGSWLRFPGKVPDAAIRFRKHQRNFVARVLQTRTALADHVVGAGKTYAAAAAAMELKRLGLARKPMIAVPNHLVKQWASDFYRLYPGANILTATKDDFKRENRRRFLARIATGDWDAVVIAHSSFGFIQPEPEFEAKFTRREIEAIQELINSMNGDDKAEKRKIKQLEKQKEKLENRIRALRDKPMDDLLDFGQIGVDQLFVDEAHLFKNLMFVSAKRDIRGLGDPTGSQRAYDMYLKMNQIFEQNGRDQGVVFLTGTPVSNSLAEMYHMMRYLMPTAMREAGFDSFDAWANTYADIEETLKPKTSGDGYKTVTAFGGFSNTFELLKMFDQVSDTVTMDDIRTAYREEHDGAEFPLPKLKGGKRQPVAMPMSADQREYMADVVRRAQALEQRKGPPQKGEDNHLSLMSDARKVAMDVRLVRHDLIEREKGGRIDRAADEILARYKQHAKRKGTQLVFSDLGTPLKTVKKELKEYNELIDKINRGAGEDTRTRAELGDETALKAVAEAEKAQTKLEDKGRDWLDAIQAALRGFSVYDDLKAALVERGIPEREIAFIHDYNGDEQKVALFRKVNQGSIRVLMGSTPKLGAGTNVQERLVALHHLDIPWKPSDVEQREGRIVRQGNRLSDEMVDGKPNPEHVPGFEVEILAYVTKDTLDKNMWDIQERKLRGINQLRTRQIAREIDNSFDEMEMSASEMQAAATGNVDLLREIQLRGEIQKLERRKRAFEGQRADISSRLESAKRDIARLPRRIEQADAIAAAGTAYGEAVQAARDAFSVTIDGKEYRVHGANAEIQRLIDAKETVDGVEKPAPISVELNGTTYTVRSKLTDAFFDLRGDMDPVQWEVDGKMLNRRSRIAAAIKQPVADAVAEQSTQEIGTIGGLSVSLDVATRGGRTMVTATLSNGEGATASTYFNFEKEKKDEKRDVADLIASHVVGMVPQWLGQLRSEPRWLRGSLASAQKSFDDASKVDATGEWPEMPKLEALRAEHKALIEKMRAPKPAAPAAPAAFKPPEGMEGPIEETGVTGVYGFASKGAPAAHGHTESALYARLRTLFGEKFIKQLLGTGKFKIVARADAGRVLGQESMSDEAGAVRGFYNPKDGITYLIADNIPEGFTDAQLRGLLRHEIGVHALKVGRKTKGWLAIESELERLRAAGDKAVTAAYERATAANTPADRVLEETAAYLVENAPESGLVRRILAWFKNQVYALTGYQMKLTDADIVAMAGAALRGAPRALASSKPQYMGSTPAMAGRAATTNSPAFKRWFGESKVVDENGEPLVVYRGTKEIGGEVLRGSIRMGIIYAATDPEYAGAFAGPPYRLGWYAPNIAPLYMKIERPLDLRSLGTDATAQDVMAVMESAGITVPDDIPSLEDPYSTVLVYMLLWNKEFIAAVRAAGLDGIALREPAAWEDRVIESDAWAAFSSTQVKSATGNRGTFDPNDPNILHSTPAPLWVSALKQRMAEQGNKTRTGIDWALWLRGNAAKLGVKKDEIEWTGIYDFLEGQPKAKLTAEAIANWLEQNGVQVRETMLGQPEAKAGGPDEVARRAQAELDQLNVRADALGYTFERREFEDGDAEFNRPILFTRRRDDAELTFDYAANWLLPDDSTVRTPEGEIQDIARALARLSLQEQGEAWDEEGTRYASYQLPGGQNYRELLLTLPVKKEPLSGWTAERFSEATGADYDGWNVKGRMPNGTVFRSEIGADDAATEAEAIAAAQRVAGAHEMTDAADTFRSGHFDQANILAHVRFNERTDKDGKRVLFIEEIQSDWAQTGRREGFQAPPMPPEELEAARQEASALTREADALTMENMQQKRGTPEWGEKFARISRLRVQAEAKYAAIRNDGTPRAPFVGDTKAWTALALKRMVRYAVDNGFDAVAWTTGRQQAMRYPGDEERDAGQSGFYDEIVPQVARDLVKKMGGGAVDGVRFDQAIIEKPYKVQIVDTTGETPQTIASFDTQGEAEGYIRANYDSYPAGLELSMNASPAHRVRKETRLGLQPGFYLTDQMRELAAQGMPLFSKAVPADTTQRTAAEVGAIADAEANKALATDATARRIMAKGNTLEDGQLVGVRLNINVLKNTGVAVQAIHEGSAAVAAKFAAPRNQAGFYNREVLAYAPVVTLRNASFNVHQPGRERIAAGASKAPMASADGAFVAGPHSYNGTEFRFNPHREHLFVDRYGRALRSADEVTITGNKVFARGTLRYFDAGDVPAKAGTAPSAAHLYDEGPGAPLFSRAPVAGAAAPGAPAAPPWQLQPTTGWMDNLDAFLYRIQDKHIDLKRVLAAIRATGAQIRQGFDAYLKEEMFHGRAAARVDDFLEQELDPLVADMAVRGVSIEQLGKYLWARHAPEANAYIASINDDLPDGGSGMTDAAAARYMAALTPQQQQDLAALAHRVDVITQGTRDMLNDYGLISDATQQTWEGMFQHYVPLYREDMDTALHGLGTGMGFSVRGKEAKERTGSALPVVDILGNIANQRDRAVVRGEKTRVGRALFGLALTNPNPDFWRTAPPPTIKTVEDVIENGVPRRKVVERVDPTYKNKDNVVVVKIPTAQGNVVERAIIFNERNERAMRMARAVKNLDGTQLGELLGTTAQITRYFAAINTQYNPIFGVVNLIRDVGTALINLTGTPISNRRGQIMADVAKIIGGAAKHGMRDFDGSWKALADEFEHAGGMTGYRDLFRTGEERTEAIEKALDPDWWMKRPWGKVLTAKGYLEKPMTLLVDHGARPILDWLSDYNKVMENSTRLAAYKAARDSGLSIEASASIAKNLTVNFNRKGELMQAGALYAFFNASVQGSARMAQTLAGPAGRYIVGGGILLGFLQAALLAAAGYDDEEPPQFVRERNLVLPLPGGGYHTLPMPLGWHVLPNIGRLLFEAMKGGEPAKKLDALLGIVADAFNPVGGSAPLAQILSPTAADPFVALSMNKDWTDKPIAREDFSSLHPTPGFTRARDTSSGAATTLAYWLNAASGGTDYTKGIVSPTPDQIEYLVGQLTGGIGREAIKAVTTVDALATGEDLPTYKIPLLGRFYGTTTGAAPQANRFYENVKRLNEHQASLKGMREDGKYAEAAEYLKDHPEAFMYRQAARATDRVSEFRRQRQKIVEQGGAGSKVRVKALDVRITAEMKRVNDRMRQIRASQ